jgi:hypothetical protein
MTTLPTGSPDLKDILAVGRRDAPAVTKVMVGALVVFAIAISVLWMSRGLPLSKVLLLSVAVIAIGLVAWVISTAAIRGLGALGQVLAW